MFDITYSPRTRFIYPSPTFDIAKYWSIRKTICIDSAESACKLMKKVVRNKESKNTTTTIYTDVFLPCSSILTVATKPANKK